MLYQTNIAGIDHEIMNDSVKEEQQEVDDKLAELEEGIEGTYIRDLEAMQDNLFDMLLIVGTSSKC